ncbi:50S ribosomal protein L22 [Patescibacteria group bacterium]|nr:50S ribosomal protein L22 [Patescibacteria group bacterium]
MEVNAKLRYLKIAPRKVRLVIDVVRGMPVEKAEYQLQFLNKGATLPVLKLLRSAIANAVNNHKLVKDNLYIKSISVNDGPTLKRWKPRAFGRASEIRKRSSHVIIILEELKKLSGKPKKLEKKIIDKAKPTSAIKKTTDKKSSAKDLRPVVDYKDIKHEDKSPKSQGQPGSESASEHGKKSGGGFTQIKERFSRKLGEG